MCNQCLLQNPCNSCTDQNTCNPCTSYNPYAPCTYDCSPPLWQTWPRIEIKRCYLGCGCHGRKHHSSEESSESTSNCHCNNLCNNYCNPCQLNPCCDPTVGLCARGCEESSSSK